MSLGRAASAVEVVAGALDDYILGQKGIVPCSGANTAEGSDRGVSRTAKNGRI